MIECDKRVCETCTYTGAIEDLNIFWVLGDKQPCISVNMIYRGTKSICCDVIDTMFDDIMDKIDKFDLLEYIPEEDLFIIADIIEKRYGVRTFEAAAPFLDVAVVKPAYTGVVECESETCDNICRIVPAPKQCDKCGANWKPVWGTTTEVMSRQSANRYYKNRSRKR